MLYKMPRLVMKVLLAFAICISLCSELKADDVLTFAVHPYLSAMELIDRFTPLTEYLEEKADKKIKIEISGDYEEHINRIGENSVHFAYMGPAPYVRMVLNYGKKPILARLEIKGKPYFRGAIIARKGSALTSLADLKGKGFAFGDPNSTMSTLVPKFMLKEAGVDVNDLAGYEFLNNHQNVVLGVLLGNFDAGAVKEEMFILYKKRGLKALAKSPPISEHLFVASSLVPADTIESLREALFDLSKHKKGVQIMNTIKKGMTGFVRAEDFNYNNLRAIMATVNSPGWIKNE